METRDGEGVKNLENFAVVLYEWSLRTPPRHEIIQLGVVLVSPAHEPVRVVAREAVAVQADRQRGRRHHPESPSDSHMMNPLTCTLAKEHVPGLGV